MLYSDDFQWGFFETQDPGFFFTFSFSSPWNQTVTLASYIKDFHYIITGGKCVVLIFSKSNDFVFDFQNAFK